jgi:hypothetical protein
MHVLKTVEYEDFDGETGNAIYCRVGDTIYFTWKDGMGIHPLLGTTSIVRRIYSQENLAWWNKETVLTFIEVLLKEHSAYPAESRDIFLKINLIADMRDPAKPHGIPHDVDKSQMPDDVYVFLKNNTITVFDL